MKDAWFWIGDAIVTAIIMIALTALWRFTERYPDDRHR